MENISPTSYIVCAKCKTTKIDVPELSNLLMGFIDKYLYCDDFSLEKEAETMDTLLSDILEMEPSDLDNETLTRWRFENKKRLFGRRYEEGELEYFLYDEVVFYHNCKCGCYLSKRVDEKHIYRVRFE
jgi:hypothetical protein